MLVFPSTGWVGTVWRRTRREKREGDTIFIMTSRQILWLLAGGMAVVGCGEEGTTDPPGVPSHIESVAGDGQTGLPGAQLRNLLTVQVTDQRGDPSPGVTVSWSVLTGGGTVAPVTSQTDIQGRASAQFTLGPAEGEQQVRAVADGVDGPPIRFTGIATVEQSTVVLSVVSGGNNVPDFYSSDLWVYGDHGYTGTWNSGNGEGSPLHAWSLDASGAPTLAGTVIVPDVGTVSDVQVSEDGQVLVASGESGINGGIYTYSLSNPNL